MINDFLADGKERMNKTVDALKKDLASLRAGRATPSLLDKVLVDYYGSQTPISQMANISAPESRLLVIQPWDKSVIGDIEKAIQKSDLGLTPNNDGSVIRLSIPQLTEERRKELAKTVKKRGEEAKVSLRNIRRDLNDSIKDLEKDKEISEDDSKRGLDEAQKLTDNFMKKLDEIVEEKENEIMAV